MSTNLWAFLQEVADNTVRIYGDNASPENAHLSAYMANEYIEAIADDNKAAGIQADVWLELLNAAGPQLIEHLGVRVTLVLGAVGKSFAEAQHAKAELGELMATTLRDSVRRQVIEHLKQGHYLQTSFETRDRKRRAGMKF